MTQEIAEIVKEDYESVQGNGIKATLLANNYFVSTVKLVEVVKPADQLISGIMKLYGITPEDLGMVAHLDMPGDYETMVFRWYPEEECRGSAELGFARYETLEEAEQGHDEMVERWRRMPGPENE